MSDTICAAIISGIISIVTIISSTLFLFINIKINRAQEKRMLQREVFSKYYLPIKFKLGNINNVYNFDSQLDIFVRKSNDALYEKYRQDIKYLYESFLNWILENQYCYSKDIDKKIFKIVEHMQFVVLNFDNQIILNQSKSQYPLPDFNDIIQNINTEFENSGFI